MLPSPSHRPLRRPSTISSGALTNSSGKCLFHALRPNFSSKYFASAFEQHQTLRRCRVVSLTFGFVKKRFFMNPKVSDTTRHRRSVWCCSKALAKYFDEKFGRKAWNKHFPEEFVNAPLEI